MAECSCWGLWAWASLSLGVVTSVLFLAALLRLVRSRGRFLRLAGG